MYTTIVVPTDCSGFDREAIRVALRLGERSGARVHLVRVQTSTAFAGMAAASDAPALSAEAVEQEYHQELTELYALAAECRTTTTAEVTVALERGPIYEALAGYAKRHNADLIVISTHGRRGFARLSLGSVTDALIRLTTIPVLVVKPPRSYLNPQVTNTIRRIVVPLDGSALAEQILPTVTRLAKLEGAELILLYVLQPHSYSQRRVQHASLPWWEKDIEAARAYLLPIADKVRRNGAVVSSDIVIGENVPEKIGEFARGEKADLIAIATHGRGGISRVLRGSVADALTTSARTSLLVFHPLMPAETRQEEPRLRAEPVLTY